MENMSLKERLELFMREMNLGPTDLVQRSGQSRSVVSQWLGNGSKEIKSIGKMEAAEGIAEGSPFRALWLARGMGPRYRVDAQGEEAPKLEQPEWPFERIDAELWWSLDQDLRQRIEAMIEGAIATNPGTGPVPTTTTAWRGVALQMAAGVDAVTKSDQFTRFVEAVDEQFSGAGAARPKS